MVYAGGDRARALLDLDEDAIRDRFLDDLDDLYPQVRGIIAETMVKKWAHAGPFAAPGRWRAQAALEQGVGDRLFFAGDWVSEFVSMETAARTAVDAAAGRPPGAERSVGARATLDVAVDEPLDERVRLLVRVPPDGAVAHALEEVVLGRRREAGDLLAELRRRLDVLVERDHVQRHGALRQPVAHVEVDARLPLGDERALVLLVEARAEHSLDLGPHGGVAERARREQLGGVVDRG